VITRAVAGTDVEAFDRTGVARGPDGIARYPAPPGSLVEMLCRTVERVPEREAVVEIGGDRLTYRMLWTCAARVAGGLAESGVRPRDRVLIRLPNGIDWCVAFLATQLAGAVAVPVNHRLAEREIEFLRTDSGAAHVLDGSRALPGGRAGAGHLPASPDEPAAIFYTSGTTGRPKGAVTSHANFLANTATARRVLGISEDELWRGLVSVPLSHVTGANSQFLPACEAGGTTVILPAFDAATFVAALTDERITALMSVPSVYRMVLAGAAALDTGRVRTLTYGGAPMAPPLIDRLRDAFPAARLSSGYGLTESSSFAAFLPHERTLARPDTVGLPVPVVDLALAGVADDGVGELLVRGPNVVAGYWGNPEATAAAFVEGWLRTGDLARIEPDGLVQLVDRVKDMIIRGGENIYAAEVERVLMGKPEVTEAAVVGVADPVAGEKVAAAVVLDPACDGELRPVWRAVRDELARHKVPQLVAVWPGPLPRNAAGKVDKAGVRAAARWRVAPR